MKNPKMIASHSFPDFVLKIEEDGTWRKFNFSFADNDYTIKTNETFNDYEEALDYVKYLNEFVGRERAKRINAI